MMLLLIDIGNTNITTGFYEGGVKNVLRFGTAGKAQDMEEYSLRLRDVFSDCREEKPEGAVICSVVPTATPLFSDFLKKSFGLEPIIVSHKLKTGLKFSLKNPEELGSDRIANAAAARKLYKGHLIVVDFGTATTFCVISSKGEYKGGSIMPGPGISADVLAEKTAKLPGVKLERTGKVIGDSTESSILSGLIFGHAGAAERIIREIKMELSFYRDAEAEGGVATDINVIATGGFADLLVPYIDGIQELNPHLTLEGLRIIYELNV